MAKEYYQLLKEDKEYLQKYKLNIKTENEIDKVIIKEVENFFEWRKIQTIQEVEDKIKNTDVKKLLRIEDYYMDEVCDLMEKYHIIEREKLSESEYCEAISDQQFYKLLDKKEIPEQLKEAITIYFSARNICDKLYNLLKTENN